MHYAYLSAGSTSWAGKELSAFRCEDGGFCASYNADMLFEVLHAVYGNGLTLSYNRMDGGMDVTVTLDCSQADDDAQANIL